MTRVNAVGIDLGTTNCCAAVVKDGRVEIITNDHGNRLTPSYVAFNASDCLVGDSAKNQVYRNPLNTVYNVKRLIGRRFDDSPVQCDVKNMQFKVIPSDTLDPMLIVEYQENYKKYTPEEVSAMVLRKMKTNVENYLGYSVEKAVITVPTYFNDAQRKATRKAGKLAGFDVLRIINEPTSAALAYGFDRKEKDKNIMVFDLGGGSFDVSILTINDEVFEVKVVAGDTHLGGEDFTQQIINYFLDEYQKEYLKDLRHHPKALSRLQIACEEAKRQLSSLNEIKIEIDEIKEGVDFRSKITRTMFEGLCGDLFRKTMEPVKKALKDAKMEKYDIDEVVLVGGSTRIPKIQAILSSFFDGKQLTKSINPEEAVAHGAAIQADIMTSSDNNALLIDVAPFSLGIESIGGQMSTIVARNSRIPRQSVKRYTTCVDNQQFITVDVYEGEMEMTRHNNRLATFRVGGIRPARKAVPVIEVMFDIDVNSILRLSAYDVKTGQQLSISRVGSGSGIQFLPAPCSPKIGEIVKVEAPKSKKPKTTGFWSKIKNIFKTD